MHRALRNWWSCAMLWYPYLVGYTLGNPITIGAKKKGTEKNPDGVLKTVQILSVGQCTHFKLMHKAFTIQSRMFIAEDEPRWQLRS